jgi:predicted lactoylglutathione lyase/predicted nucleic-acid-binding Zn-ribbon protein
MRNWGLWRIRQIMGYIQRVYENDDIDALFDTIGIESDEELKRLATTKEERNAILALLKAVIKCKKKGIKSIKLLEYSVESLFKALKKHTTTIFEPYCDECNHYTEVACKNCGYSQITQLQVKKQKTVVYCAFCHEPMDLTNLECIEGHRVKLFSWYDGVLFKPLSNLSDLVANLINKYFKNIGFSLNEEYFYVQNNELHYSDATATKVMYNITEIEQFKNVWDRNITEQRREELKEVLKIIAEKCSRHSNEACHACQDEKSVLCIMRKR